MIVVLICGKMSHFDTDVLLSDLLLDLKTNYPKLTTKINTNTYSNGFISNILPYQFELMSFNDCTNQPLLVVAIDNECMEAIDAIFEFITKIRDALIYLVLSNCIRYCAITKPDIFDLVLDKIIALNIIGVYDLMCRTLAYAYNFDRAKGLKYYKTIDLIKSYGKSKCININLLYNFCFEHIDTTFFTYTCYEYCSNIDWTQQNNKFIKNLTESPFDKTNRIILIEKIILNKNTKAYSCIPQISKSYIPYLFMDDIHQYEKLIHKLIYEQHAQNHLKLCIIDDMFLNYNPDVNNVIKKLLSFVMEHNLKKYLLQQNGDMIFHNV